MGKKERLQNRVTRIDNRFIDKVKKGKKGTDMDIATHEARIQRLADKGGFTAPFMAKSPLLEAELTSQEKRKAQKKTENTSIAMMPYSAVKPVVNVIKKGVKSVVDFYSGAKNTKMKAAKKEVEKNKKEKK